MSKVKAIDGLRFTCHAIRGPASCVKYKPRSPGHPLVNPFIFKTKTEVVANLATYQAEDLIATHALVHTRRFANAEEVLGFG